MLMVNMIKVFDHENVDEIINKKPLMCYYSENGACGPSGLFFVIFEDRSCYAYSTYYPESDTNLIHRINECVPELRSLLGGQGDYQYQRKSTLEDMEYLYLGLGNYGLVEHQVYKKVKRYKKEHIFSAFMKVVEGYVKEKNQIYNLVKKAIVKK